MRVAWVEQALKEIPAGSRLLDAGAGAQPFRKLCPHLRYVAQDFGRYDGKGDSRGLHTGSMDYGPLDIVSDIASIPEPDASFDAIMCIEVLEHLPDPLPALREFSRLLKPGGTLLLTAPFCSLTHLAPYHFSTGFSRYFYEKHLADHGFEIIEIQSNGNFFEYVAQEIYRIPFVTRRYASRSPGFLEHLALFMTLRILRRCSARDRGSSELLCFGYHIRAVKKGAS